MAMIQAVTISIGDELLSGKTIDSNNAFISQQLLTVGIPVSHKLIIGDARDHILEALDWAFEKAEIVTLTGGLGPTHDDITKQVLCDYFDAQLIRYPEILERMRLRFEKRGFKLATINEGQADYPDNAQILNNSVGTAQGMHFKRGERHLFVMPGVPSEMRAITQEEIIPILERMTGSHTAVMDIHTNGYPESSLYELTKPILDEWPELKVAYLPKHFTVTIRISMPQLPSAEQEELFDRIYERIRNTLPEYVYGRDADTLASVVGSLLLQQQATVTTAESCTGGLIASMLTDVSGSSEYFETGYVTYSNQTKMKLLGVSAATLESYGAVSEQTVSEMLRGALQVSRAGFAIAVSGIAGPTGGSDEKPVGTVYIGVGDSHKQFIKRFQFGHHRIQNKELSANAALNMLRRLLEGE